MSSKAVPNDADCVIIPRPRVAATPLIASTFERAWAAHSYRTKLGGPSAHEASRTLLFMILDRLNHFLKGCAIAMLAALMLSIAIALALLESLLSSGVRRIRIQRAPRGKPMSALRSMPPPQK